MVSIFVLSLTTLVVIGVLKIVTMLHHTYFYWKCKGLPYLSISSFMLSWKWLLGYISYMDYWQYVYNYFPNAKYVGMVDLATPVIFIRDPELIKDMMVKDFDHFSDHHFFIDESIEPLWGKSLFALRGKRWRNTRNTLSPSFTSSKMKFMFDLMSKCSDDFVKYLVDHPELCHAIELKEAFGRYTNDIFITTAFGINVNSMKDKENEFYVKASQAIKCFSGWVAMAKLIFSRMCPWLFKSMGLTIFPSDTSKFFKEVIEEVVTERKKLNIVRRDFIHLLTQTRDEDDISVHKMTLDDIVSHVASFYFAGFENSSTTICFIAHELALNRDIQDRLREEIQQHLAEGNGAISYDLLSKMSYMDMVITEILRKYPPLPTLNRLCVKKYELPPSQPGYNNMIIEPNTMLILSIYALHHDPKYFPNPDKFDPERFSEANKNNVLPFTYLPFGGGPRKCIGYRFAFMEFKILIVHLLQKFTLKVIDKTVEPVIYAKNEMTLRTVDGFWIGLEKRET